jgi:hypothetical protein
MRFSDLLEWELAGGSRFVDAQRHHGHLGSLPDDLLRIPVAALQPLGSRMRHHLRRHGFHPPTCWEAPIPGGHEIRVAVTASDASGSATTTSKATKIVS